MDNSEVVSIGRIVFAIFWRIYGTIIIHLQNNINKDVVIIADSTIGDFTTIQPNSNLVISPTQLLGRNSDAGNSKT
jgi:UDP-3-O-[3-hydroxymyristoyl] glucosamine N-acyltransferase